MIACIRVVYLPIRPSDDDLYRQVSGALWSMAELCAAMIVTCLPVLRPLFFRATAGRRVARGPASSMNEPTSEPAALCLRRWMPTGDDDGREAQRAGALWGAGAQHQHRDFWVDKKVPRSEALPGGLQNCRGSSACGGSNDRGGTVGGSLGSGSGSSSRTRTIHSGRGLSVTWASDLEKVIPAPPATASPNASASRVGEADIHIVEA